jgi:hypothetical protein
LRRRASMPWELSFMGVSFSSVVWFDYSVATQPRNAGVAFFQLGRSRPEAAFGQITQRLT